MEALSDGLLTETNPFIQIDVSRHANPPSLAGKQAVYLLFSLSPDEDPKSRGFSEKSQTNATSGKKTFEVFCQPKFSDVHGTIFFPLCSHSVIN
mgnify:CR=1 FL=1